MIQNTIRKRLLRSLIFLAIVPLLLMGIILSWQSFTVQKTQGEELQHELTKQVARNLAFYFHAQEHKLYTLLKTNYLPGMSREQQSLLLSKFLFASKKDVHGHVFNEAALLDKVGREIARQSLFRLLTEDDLHDRSETDEFLVPLQTGKSYYGPVFFDEETGRPGMIMSVPLWDLQSRDFVGVLVAEMDLMSMQNLVEETKIGTNGIVYIVNRQGRVVVHPNPSVILKDTHFQVPHDPAIIKGLAGKRAVVASSKLGYHGLNLTVVTEIPASEAFSHLPRSLLIIGLILILTLMSAIAFGFILVRQLVQPVESLAATARMISLGNISQKIEFKRLDEFGDLAEALNTMTSRLMKTIQALESEKNLVKNTIEALSHPFYVIDVKDYTVKLANSAANFGPLTEENKCYKLTHGADEPCGALGGHPCPIDEIRRTGKPVVLEHMHCKNGNTEKSFAVYGYPIYDTNGELIQVIEYNIDISERKNLEEQLRQSQKLEGIGRLAGGVAHDFNNLLTPIIGYSEITLKKLDADDPLKERMEVIYDSARRAAALTRQLLAFSRKQVMEIKVIDLNDLINNLAKMLKRLIGEDVETELMLHDLDGCIKADPGQVEQIIMNLSVNARDAMPSGGSLILETGVIDLDEEYCRMHAEVSPGSYIVLSVTDTGEGLAPGIKDKIFDPFFTTKEKGKGTGLGLATVYGIVKQLKGHIFVYSEIDSGTTFKIYFPKVQEEADTAVKREVKSMANGTERILVVDDEPSILKLVIDTLKPLGYNVTGAHDGQEALHLCETTDKKFDLLLTDVIMPKMGGSELADKMKAACPHVKVLFMSGYTDNVIAHKGVLKPGLLFINKPLVPSLLVAKIREIFDKN